MTNSEAVEYFYNKMSSGSIQNDYQQEVFEQSINTLEENTKLKKENDRLSSDNAWLVLNKSEKEFENVDLLEERDKLKADIEQLKDDSKIIAKELVTQIREIGQLKSELEQSVKFPCKVGDEFYCIAYEENPMIVKVFCDGYGIIKNNLTEPEQRFLWMTNIKKPSDYWKIDFSIFNEKMFKTEEEAEQSLKGQV